MRLIRGPINAILVATLLKPIARRIIATWRRRARDYADETFIIPAQELLETALAPQLLLADSSLPAADAEAIGETGGRSVLRTLVIVGALATIVAATVVAVGYVRRRRAEVASQPEAAQEVVAVPIEASEEESEEVVSPEQEPAPSEA
jgi:hypothetical protein